MLLGVAALFAVGCSDASPSGSPDRPTVIATTNFWADVVTGVTCDGLATVESIIPAGTDVHAFEPSLADRGALENAVLVVANGLSLEQGFDDILRAVESSGTPVFRAGDHAGTGDDPHVWFDPTLVAAALPALADQLAAAGFERTCEAAYAEELHSLDGEIAGQLGGLGSTRRKLVTSHDSLRYFADRYGFEIVGTIVPAATTLAATSPAELSDLATAIDASGVEAIFVEPNYSTDDARALADQLDGVEVVLLAAETGADGKALAYPEFLRANARLIADALG